MDYLSIPVSLHEVKFHRLLKPGIKSKTAKKLFLLTLDPKQNPKLPSILTQHLTDEAMAFFENGYVENITNLYDMCTFYRAGRFAGLFTYLN